MLRIKRRLACRAYGAQALKRRSVKIHRQNRFNCNRQLFWEFNAPKRAPGFVQRLSGPFQRPIASLTPTPCQTQNYLRIVQRYLRMVENFAMLHYSLLQRAPPENHCVLTQLRWPLRSNCCPAVQFDGGADRSLLDLRGACSRAERVPLALGELR
jgi:hypothetical protein